MAPHRTPIVVAALPLLLVAGPLAAQEAEVETRGPRQDVEALEERGRDWVDAARREDAAALVDLYEEDAVFLPPGRPEIVGREAIRSLFEAQFERFDAEYDFAIREIVVSGDWAFRRGAYTVRARLDDGADRTIRDKFIDVWHRGSDGRWRIARDIWNRTAEPGAGPGS